MCALAARSCAGAGYQLLAVLQNPQLRQKMASVKAVFDVVCQGRFKGANRPSAPWPGKAGLPSGLQHPSIDDHPASSPLNLKFSA